MVDIVYFIIVFEHIYKMITKNTVVSVKEKLFRMVVFIASEQNFQDYDDIKVFEKVLGIKNRVHTLLRCYLVGLL